MSADLDKIRSAVEPVVRDLGLVLYDVELSGNGRARVLRVLLQRDAGVIDIDDLTAATRALDGVVDDLVPGAFSLEVSSPGLERPLRRPEHFAGARGVAISVKYRESDGTGKRVRAQLIDATDSSIEVLLDSGERTRIDISAITAAHTVFEWGPAPRPGKGPKPGSGPRPKETTPS